MEIATPQYTVGGRTFRGYLADGSDGRRVPGVLVAHEGPGLTEHPEERARRLAELGYVALALDLYGEVDPPLERAKELVQELRADRAELRRRGAAALGVLAEHPGVDAKRLAAVGFCFGGSAMIELARGGADLRCVVGFHSGLDTAAPGDACDIRGQLLLCMGDRDPVVTVEQRRAFLAEMDAAGVPWQMILFGGVGHSFTNPEIDAWGFPGFAYDAAADRRAWRAMRDLFGELLDCE